MPFWIVTLSVERLCARDCLAPEDRDDPLLRDGGCVTFVVRAQSAADAECAAEDYFHDRVAIALLDDFDIMAKALPVSAHEEVALAAAHPPRGDLPEVIKMGAPRIDPQD